MRNQERYRVSFLATLLGGLALATISAVVSGANPSPPVAMAFDTPKQAADALVKAAEANDVPELIRIFGATGQDIVASGDSVEDKNNLAKFVEKAHQKTEISYGIGDPNRAVLVVGSDDWPMPVPLVRKSGKWRFDAKEGREEILARRIGGNELDAITLLRGYVEAQKEYALELHDGSTAHQYAQKWISSPGKQDGLSWTGPDGKPAGPIGEEIAKLLAEGYTSKSEPVNGYYFRTLTAQGQAARLGARNYVVNGKMIGGFAAIAWPAKYGVTGIMTMQVNSDGDIYQKDLGPNTAAIAPTIKAYNPDKTWVVTEDEE